MNIKKLLLCLICMLFIGSVYAIDDCPNNGRVCFQYPTEVKAGQEFEVTLLIKNAVDLKYVKATNFRADGVTDNDTDAATLSGFVGTGANYSPFKAFNLVTGLEMTNESGKNGNVQVLKLKFKAKSNLTTTDLIHIRMDEVFIGSNVNGTNTENISNDDGYCVTIRVTEGSTVPSLKCEYKDGKYYDKNGNIVTKAEYERDCETTPKCKIENGKYYDNAGNVVTKEAYEEACGNPETGINSTLIIVVAGTLLVLGCYAFFKKSKMYY